VTQENLKVQRDMKDERYRVILHRIGENTEDEKNRFCEEVSKTYGISLHLMKKIADRCPIVIKKDLSFQKAKMLANVLQSSGASVSVERKQSHPPVSLEFIEGKPYRLGLESSNLRQSPGGTWQLLGRVLNIFEEELGDIWALIQVFDKHGELVAFEEIPLPINPLPPKGASPFKALFEKELPLDKVSIAFKTASGNPLPAMDQREKREWVEVSITENGKRGKFLSATEISEEVLSSFEPPLSLAPEANEKDLTRQNMEEVPTGGSPLLTEEISILSDGIVTIPEEKLDPAFYEKDGQLFEEDHPKEQEQLEILGGEDQSQEIIRSLVLKEGIEEEELHLDCSMDEPIKGEPHFESVLPLFDKEEVKAEETVVSAELKTEGKPMAYPWLDDFKRAIEAYEQNNKGPFLLWFEKMQNEGKFENPYHSLLTVLIYARFNQTSCSDTALENTQKVFHLSAQTDVSPDQIPPLQGDLFFPSDIWRDLYIRAIPKLQEVSRRILEPMRWKTSDLDRLIRIIPHMTARNSRWVIRVLHHWLPDVVSDVSEMTININDGVYRLASRLGVVDPLFDFYQGKNSIGDLKIQSFARASFPEDPGKVEEPMSRLGAKDEEGCCLPTQPRCHDCPLEHFCPKLFIDFDPSEKGMMLQSWQNIGGTEWRDRNR
jgi:DNA-binding MarR family transcriptional regulator